MKRINIHFLLATLLITSCGEEKIDKPLNPENINLLAVEGVLTNERMLHRVQLTLPYQTLNGNPKAASGASIQISDGENVYPLTESPAGSGSYYTPEFRASFGLIYTLVIQYEGKQYTASDSSIPVEPLTVLDYLSTDNGYELTLSATGQSPNYIDHAISWKNTTLCNATSSCEGRLVYYDLKTIDANEIFKPDKAKFTFPANSVVVRRKYSTSSAYKKFLRSMLSETEWRGGVFDVDRANANTNLSNGAIGFFAVSTVVSDTTVITQKP